MKTNRKMMLRRKLVYAVVISCFTVTPAFANPIGATVVNGQVGFATQGSTLTVTNSPNAIINWQQFSINTGETTRFIQQSAQSAVLNRVVGQDPSQLLGSLLSNGRVYLINPNGILFGQGAVIDVGGLVASTLKLTDGDFLAGRLNFTDGVGAGGINNQGSITTPTGGNVYLIAPDITNSGVITSPQGEILLAAGHTINLMDTTNPNVQVTLSAPATQAANLGSIIASSGRIGIYAGLVNQAGTINADAAVVGDGGKIILKATGSTQVSGSLSARGGENGGDGGFIETSGAHVNIADSARIDTSAPQGKTGTWLIDPLDFTIAAAGGNITGATLSTNLGLGSVVITNAAGAGNGDIFVNNAVSWSANNTLTLSAYRNVNVNSNITATGSTAGLTLTPSNTGAGGSYYLNNGAVITLSGSNPSLSIAGNAYTVINEANGGITALQNISGNLTGNYALGTNIDATVTNTWNAGAGFLPLTFNGTFNGLSHTITNLFINRPGMGYVGLFGSANGVIQNVGLVGGSVTGNTWVGALVGIMYAGSINHAYSTASVNGVQEVGGLVGNLQPNCSIFTSYSSGNLTTINGVGQYGGTPGSWFGGLVGWNNGAITNSYATGNVNGSTTGVNVGGLVGIHQSFSGSVITNSYSTGLVSGASVVGGLVGLNNSGAIIGSFWNTQTSGTTVGVGGGILTGPTGMTTAQMQQQATYTGWDFVNTWGISPGNYPFLLGLGGGATAPPPPSPDVMVLNAVSFGANTTNDSTTFNAFIEPIRIVDDHEDKKNEKPVCR